MIIYEIPAYNNRMKDIFGFKQIVCWNKRLIIELKMCKIKSFYTSPNSSTSYFLWFYYFWKINILKFFNTYGTPQWRISFKVISIRSWNTFSIHGLVSTFPRFAKVFGCFEFQSGVWIWHNTVQIYFGIFVIIGIFVVST